MDTKQESYIGYVYKIFNDINDKLYIGETIRSLRWRFKRHCRDAFKSKLRHYNCHLYRAMRKYGIEHFYIEELCCISDTNKESLKYQIQEIEKQYIKDLGTFYHGYNSDTGGRGGKIINDYSRKLMSDKRKNNKKLTELLNKAREKSILSRQRAIDGYNYNTGEKIIEFKNICTAANTLNIDSSSISKCCSKKHSWAGILDGIKITWRYKNDPYIVNYVVSVVSEDGLYQNKFVSIAEASRFHNVNNSSIIRCCKGIKKSAGKYNGQKLIWKYINYGNETNTD